MPGKRTPPKNGLGMIVRPPIIGSKSGISRSAPISQPMYQSGWAPLVPMPGLVGPVLPDRVDLDQPAEQHQHAGDGAEEPAGRRRTRATVGDPTTFRSRRPGPRNWVWR